MPPSSDNYLLLSSLPSSSSSFFTVYRRDISRIFYSSMGSSMCTLFLYLFCLFLSFLFLSLDRLDNNFLELFLPQLRRIIISIVFLYFVYMAYTRLIFIFGGDRDDTCKNHWTNDKNRSSNSNALDRSLPRLILSSICYDHNSAINKLNWFENMPRIYLNYRNFEWIIWISHSGWKWNCAYQNSMKRC